MYSEKVTWVHHWSENIFSFRTTRNSSFRFVAGEFAMIGIKIDDKNVLRAYSVASPPWADYLEFLSIKIPDGKLTSKLQNIQIGDEILIKEKTTGTVVNSLLLPGKKLWLLATGTGLAPFMSTVQDLEILEQWEKIELLHSVSYRKNLAYFEQLSNKFNGSELHEMIADKLTYTPVLTREGDKRITDKIKNNELNIDYQNDRIMICGNMDFNKEMMTLLKERGMKEGTYRQSGTFVIERAFVEQ